MSKHKKPSNKGFACYQRAMELLTLHLDVHPDRTVTYKTGWSDRVVAETISRELEYVSPGWVHEKRTTNFGALRKESKTGEGKVLIEGIASISHKVHNMQQQLAALESESDEVASLRRRFGELMVTIQKMGDELTLVRRTNEAVLRENVRLRENMVAEGRRLTALQDKHNAFCDALGSEDHKLEGPRPVATN